MRHQPDKSYQADAKGQDLFSVLIRICRRNLAASMRKYRGHQVRRDVKFRTRTDLGLTPGFHFLQGVHRPGTHLHWPTRGTNIPAENGGNFWDRKAFLSTSIIEQSKTQTHHSFVGIMKNAFDLNFVIIYG